MLKQLEGDCGGGDLPCPERSVLDVPRGTRRPFLAEPSP